MSEPTIEQLLENFPKGNNRRTALKWLLKVFVLWDEAANQAVTSRRNEIAEKLGRQYGIAPNPELTQPKGPVGSEEYQKDLLIFAITTLRSDQPVPRSINCWFFVDEVERWLAAQP